MLLLATAIGDFVTASRFGDSAFDRCFLIVRFNDFTTAQRFSLVTDAKSHLFVVSLSNKRHTPQLGVSRTNKNIAIYSVVYESVSVARYVKNAVAAQRIKRPSLLCVSSTS